MFTIEEAKATDHTTTVNIPAGASREFGKGAVERAIEEKALTEQANSTSGIWTVLGHAWNKLTGVDAIAPQTKEAAR